MPDMPARPTLLSAAKSFIRKSAGTAALAIAPLAAVSLAPEAKAQTIFGTPGLNFSSSGSASLTKSFPSGSRFYASGSTTNNIRSLRFGVDGTMTTDHVSGGNSVYETFQLFTSISNLDIPASTALSLAYDFTLSKQVGIAGNVNWNIRAGITSDGALQSIASGSLTSGSATFTGSGTYTTTGLVTADLSKDFTVYLELIYTTAQSDVLFVGMNSASQGFTLSAIPEPSTYALMLGFGALGVVVLRRFRRSAA